MHAIVLLIKKLLVNFGKNKTKRILLTRYKNLPEHNITHV